MIIIKCILIIVMIFVFSLIAICDYLLDKEKDDNKINYYVFIEIILALQQVFNSILLYKL